MEQENMFARPEMKFKKKAVAALMTFKRKKTFKGTEQERMDGMTQLITDLARIYAIAPNPELIFRHLDGGHSGMSYVLPPRSLTNPEGNW